MFWKPKREAADDDLDPNLPCSFCGRPRSDVKQLVAVKDVRICDDCLELSRQVLLKEAPLPRPPVMPIAALTQAIAAHAVGQAAVVEQLAALLAAHLGRPDEGAGRAVRVLLVGPCGSGKTTLARAVCAATGLPGQDIDLNRMTATGYVGEDIENVLAELVAQADGNKRLAQHGVLALDGLHHLALQRLRGDFTRDVGAADVQRHLLRVLGGTRCAVYMGPRHPQREVEPFDPSGVFCLITASMDDVPSEPRALRERLRESGLMGELLARIDVLLPVPRPDANAMAAILDAVAARRATPKLAIEAAARAYLGEQAARSKDGAWALERWVLMAATARASEQASGAVGMEEARRLVESG